MARQGRAPRIGGRSGATASPLPETSYSTVKVAEPSVYAVTDPIPLIVDVYEDVDLAVGPEVGEDLARQVESSGLPLASARILQVPS